MSPDGIPDFYDADAGGVATLERPAAELEPQPATEQQPEQPDVLARMSPREQAMVRYIQGDPQPNDMHFFEGMNRDDFERETTRVERVLYFAPKSGSWQQLSELQASAAKLEADAKRETDALEAELAEVERRIAELNGQVNAATSRAESMTFANQSLRTSAPSHVVRQMQLVTHTIGIRFGEKNNALNHAIGPRQVAVDSPVTPMLLRESHERNIVNSDISNLVRVLSALGCVFTNRAELANQIDKLKTRFAAELPGLRQQLADVEAERDEADRANVALLDCDLPA